ncbi:MAG TPA: D-alanyl-D-alanine carboxypeptidase/D-alanyl-D-alanine-endopeptidase, partial [Chitinophagaceae bacterium]|nr:D-alanyl-D-alanine carboxypeptidase/D-alanyl-D-alanine-endopeptidase [Chitinophagaceae bacterium]
MNRILFVLVTTFVCICTGAQGVATAFKQFEDDPQLQSAIASIYIIDAKTGKPIFEKNSSIGLPPASTQKIITSISAYELLGEDFRFTTKFGLSKDGAILYILPGGDPTLGSWRWPQTKEAAVLTRVIGALKKGNVKAIKEVVSDEVGWEEESVPDGWIWQDIGNYYGAGAKKLNWRENQFDLILKSGSQINDPVIIAGTVPHLKTYKLQSFVRSAAKGTGDNAYIYFPLNSLTGVVRGTIPLGENNFVISGAFPPGENIFMQALVDSLVKANIFKPGAANNPTKKTVIVKDEKDITLLHTETSPSLDSIIYWFNKKSINLYGEALLKTIAFGAGSEASPEKAVKIIKDFWVDKGVKPSELNMVDGSGLSPLNRVTTHAQVTILQYAKKQNWFSHFYNALPEYNGMKMKSGTIS